MNGELLEAVALASWNTVILRRETILREFLDPTRSTFEDCVQEVPPKFEFQLPRETG